MRLPRCARNDRYVRLTRFVCNDTFIFSIVNKGITYLLSKSSCPFFAFS